MTTAEIIRLHRQGYWPLAYLLAISDHDDVPASAEDVAQSTDDEDRPK